MYRVIIATTYYLLSGLILSGQTIDSLEQYLKTENLTTIEKVNTMNVLSRDLSFVNVRKAMEYAGKALDMSLKTDYIKGVAYAYRNLSNIYINNEIYFQGMDYAQKALKLFNSMNDSVGIADCYISLGFLYRQLENYKEELEYHKNAHQIYSHLHIMHRIGVTSHNLAYSYFSNGDFENCRKYILYSININDSIHQTAVLSSCFKVLGLLEFAQGNYGDAEKYLLKVLQISNQLGANSQKIATIESMIHLSLINKANKNPELQLHFLEEANAFCLKNSISKYLPQIYNELILYYSDNNKQYMVQKYISEYTMISDTIRKRNLYDKSELVNNLILFHSLEKEKNLLDQNEKLQKESIQRRNFLLSVSMLVLLVLLWLLLKLSRAIKEVKKANQFLQHQKETIETQKNQLEVINSTKDKLFSIIAHDLRSPFTAIIGFSDVVIENLTKYETEKTLKLVTLINQSAVSTLDLLEKLLFWAKNQTGQIGFNPISINITQFATALLEHLYPSAKIKDIKLVFHQTDVVEIYADRNLLKIILRNLIQNAIKYTPRGGQISLKAVRNNSEIEITVSDNGIGMSEEIKNHVFLIDKKQIRPGTDKEKGTGLGLILCSEFVEKHGGKIWVESVPDKGSDFKFTLPVVPLSKS
jgi:signal transduction histidine kinase